jgi:hypothetical protein
LRAIRSSPPYDPYTRFEALDQLFPSPLRSLESGQLFLQKMRFRHLTPFQHHVRQPLHFSQSRDDVVPYFFTPILVPHHSHLSFGSIAASWPTVYPTSFLP